MDSRQKITELSIDANSLIPGIRYTITTFAETPIRPFTGTFVEYNDTARIMGKLNGRVINELDVRQLQFTNLNGTKSSMFIHNFQEILTKIFIII